MEQATGAFYESVIFLLEGSSRRPSHRSKNTQAIGASQVQLLSFERLSASQASKLSRVGLSFRTLFRSWAPVKLLVEVAVVPKNVADLVSSRDVKGAEEVVGHRLEAHQFTECGLEYITIYHRFLCLR